jgi:hypothetical protein
MSTLGDLLAEHTVLPGNAVDHLHAVVGEWQLLADLSFADYLMWVRRDDGALVCVAQCRPNTAATVLLSDAVGTVAAPDRLPLVAATFESGTIGRESTAGEQNVEAVPVRHDDRVVAVLTHQTALAAGRKSSRLESAYLACAQDLVHMLSEGTFPDVGDLAMSSSTPRVGDGLIRLDVDGAVSYASPNALSAYHRMGLNAELAGHDLVAITWPLISDPFEAQELADHVHAALTGGSSMRLEVDAAGAVVLLRTLPLVVHGTPAGAAVLVRDVTEVKRRDRALLSKDATELVQNAIEHAFDPAATGRSVTIRADRSARWLDVVVHDDGHGLPDGFSLEKSDRLGLQIVRTLVSTELDGSLVSRDVPGDGTDMVLRIPVGSRRLRPAQ